MTEKKDIYGDNDALTDEEQLKIIIQDIDDALNGKNVETNWEGSSEIIGKQARRYETMLGSTWVLKKPIQELWEFCEENTVFCGQKNWDLLVVFMVMKKFLLDEANHQPQIEETINEFLQKINQIRKTAERE